MKFFDEIEIGDTYALGDYTFTADAIKTFARRFDPQLFHVDEEAAAASHFGALCASGWHTAAVWMRLYVDHRRGMIEAARAAGLPIPALGPAVGFRDLKWMKPVYVGDTIEYSSIITDKRTSKSRPRSGLLTIKSTGVNQNGDPVISFVSTTFAERRGEPG